MRGTGGVLWRLTGWLVLLFYLAGVADYLMTRWQVEPYFRFLTPDQQAWVAGLPIWVGALWALGVWAGFLGGLLMVMRQEGGVIALALAALCLIGLVLHVIAFAEPTLSEVAGREAEQLMLAVAALSFLMWLFPRWLKRRAR